MPNTLWKWSINEDLKDDSWMNSHGDPITSRKLSKLAELVILKDNDAKKVTKDQCFLINPSMLCFALNIKSWCKLTRLCAHETTAFAEQSCD